jgi:hypothetical protein
MGIKTTPRLKPLNPVTPTPTPTPTNSSTPVTVKPGDPGFIGPTTIVNPGGIPWTQVVANADPTGKNFKVHDTNNTEPNYSGHCQRYGEYSVLGHGGVYGGAIDWEKYSQDQKHFFTGDAPAGVPVFYDTKNPNRHVTISAGNGYVWTTGENGAPITKVKASDLYGGPAGWSDIVQGKAGGDPEYIKYDVSTIGKAYKPTDTGTGGAAAEPKKPIAPTPPTVIDQQPAKPNTSSSSQSSSSGSSMPFGSFFSSIFGGVSQPNRAVAQGASSALSAMNPGMSTQFDGLTPSATNESTSSGSSADTTSSIDEPNSDVTVKPVGS